MTTRALLLVALIWPSSAISQVEFGDCPQKAVQTIPDPDLLHRILPPKSKSSWQGSPTVSVAELQVPRNARDTLWKARELLQKKGRNDAISYVDKALEFYPRFAEALALRALLELDTNRERAQADAEKAVEYDSADSKGHLALASVYIVLGKFDDAIHALDYVIAVDPEVWQGHFQMSRALIGKRDYLAAFHQMQTTCKLVPKAYPILHLAKAEILMGLNSNRAAAVELETYLAEEPNAQESPEARKRLDNLSAARRRD